MRVFEHEGRAGQLAATGLFGEASKALSQKFPARQVPGTWPATASSTGQVLDRLSRPPLKAGPQVHWRRTHGTRILLGWLASLPGDTWQQRWHASRASSLGKRWTEEPLAWRVENAPELRAERITEGLNALILADVLRPDMDWLTVITGSRHWRRLFATHRDPDGFARLAAVAGPDVVRVQAGHRALNQVGVILAAKGGMISDITVGDCLELREAERRTRSEGAHSRSLFYDLLRELGNFPPGAPPTLRHWNRMAGQVSVAQLVDRYALQCRPVRDLIVDYLTERQPAMDYTTLEGLSRILAFHFWKTLETLSPGIDSLRLAPDVAAAWKQRVKVKVTQRRQPDGTVVEVTSPRANAFDLLTSVRSFYLDIAQWALEEPARWGPWAAPCPVSAAEGSHRKSDRQRKARMDQRTRERLPSVAALSRLADQRRAEALARLGAVRAAEPGGPFTVLGETMVKVRGARQDREGRGLAFDEKGARRNLILEEHRAFWTWAAVEFFRSTGCRIEEMMEVSHHSVTQYAVPRSGEVIPLLQIAPSKTDTERLLVVDAELADVLATIISRIRGADGTVPLVSAWDIQEKVWNPPLPLLFQWTVAGHKRGVSQTIIRKGLNELLNASGLTDAAGQPLRLSPHDFRRVLSA